MQQLERRRLAPGRAMGVTTPEEVMRVTKDQTLFGHGKKRPVEKPEIDVVPEVEVKPKLALPNIDLRHPCHFFNTKPFKPPAESPRARLRPAGGRRPSAKWRKRASSRSAFPRKPPPKAASKSAAAPPRRRAGPGPGQFQSAVQESFAADAGEFHPAAFQFAGGGRALEPRPGHSLQRSLQSGRRQPNGRPFMIRWWTAFRWPTRWPRCPRPFPASMWRWCRRAKPADSWTWCWRRSPISSCGKGFKSQGHGGDALPGHFVVSGHCAC